MNVTMWLNIFIIGITLAFAFCIAWLSLSQKRNISADSEERPEILYSLDGLMKYVRSRVDELTRTNLFELALEADEFKKRENKREELKRALRYCAYGSDSDKQYVKSVLLDMLDAYIPVECIHLSIPFSQPERMTAEQIFACLMHDYRKRFGLAAFATLVEIYELDRPKLLDGEDNVYGYVITEEEIRSIHSTESIIHSRIDKLEIITQFIYGRYKGHGPIDELRDMDIDGISGGVSGVVENDLLTDLPRSHDSIWVFFRGKSIRLACTGFGSDKELRRVCQNIYRYNKAGQLSESNGYKVSELKDGSRVVVVRPPFSESWAFFVRKFQTRNLSLEKLITDKNSSLPISLISFLAKGCMITALTGSQGSGKTTLLMEMIRHIDAAYPIRIQEMAFELHVRRLYPERNILSFRETETVSGQEGLDLQKKTDGSVNILGEVATDEVAAWMIQMAQVASIFTIFTHHAKTTGDLVLNLRNALLKCNMFSDEIVAEQQVAAVLDFDIHLARDVSGHRYIERITEIIETDRNVIYPDSWKDETDIKLAQHRFLDSTQSFYERVTDRKTHEARNILVFRDGAYHAVHKPSVKHISEITTRMRHKDKAEFLAWLETWWPSNLSAPASERLVADVAE